MNRALLAFVMLLAACGSIDAAPPLESYGHLPGVDTIQLSPSGERYAVIGVVGEQRRIIVANAAGKVLQMSGIGSAKVRGLTWMGEDHVLVTVTSTFKSPLILRQAYELEAVANLNVSSGKMFGILDKIPSTANVVVGHYGSAQVDGHNYGYFGGITYERNGAGDFFFDHGYADLYQVDLDSGKTRMVAHGSEFDHEWVVGPDGAVVAHSEYEQHAGKWRLYVGKERDKILLEKDSPLDALDLAGQGRTAGTVLVFDSTDSDDIVSEISVADGRREELFRNVSVDDILRDRDTGRVLGFITHGEPHAKFFDGNLQARLNATRKAFPALQMQVESVSRNLDRLIVKTDGGDDSGTYWLVDIASGKADPVGFAYPTVRAADVGPTRWFKYKASDGLAMEGVLTLPPGRKAEHLPVVVLPHGGPIGVADRIGFDWWAQAYASAGYAVFQPNYRGSDDYGKAFRDAAFGEWGRKMQTDLSDGLAALAAEGVVDAKRSCIVGGSYGGYAALAGVTLQHGLYRCAVAVAGPSDLPDFFYWESVRHGASSSHTRYWRAVTGADKEGDGAMRRISPARFAEQADAPILLIHGADDTVVPIAQSEKMAAALKSAAKPFEFLRMQGEDHWLSREATRTAMLKAAVEFVKRYNPAD